MKLEKKYLRDAYIEFSYIRTKLYSDNSPVSILAIRLYPCLIYLENCTKLDLFQSKTFISTGKC